MKYVTCFQVAVEKNSYEKTKKLTRNIAYENPSMIIA